jgi:hypothetical protein
MFPDLTVANSDKKYFEMLCYVKIWVRRHLCVMNGLSCSLKSWPDNMFSLLCAEPRPMPLRIQLGDIEAELIQRTFAMSTFAFFPRMGTWSSRLLFICVLRQFKIRPFQIGLDQETTG